MIAGAAHFSRSCWSTKALLRQLSCIEQQTKHKVMEAAKLVKQQTIQPSGGSAGAWTKATGVLDDGEQTPRELTRILPR